MKIAFFADHLGERGTEVALFDYAYYNQKILNNKSIVIYKTNSVNNKNIIKKFRENFEFLFHVNNFSEVDPILTENNVSHIYYIRSGQIDNRLSKVAINCSHGVFACQPHGDIYASISPSVSGYNKKTPVVPHMISLPKHDRNMRNKLNIPEEAIVFGGYGGSCRFNIKFVHDVVYKIASSNKNIYFLFANFRPFCAPLPNIIHLPMITELDKKVEFINSCDAMIWARSDGETFGLAIAEFSTLNKPVIAMKCGYREHVNILGNKAFWYSNSESLTKIIENFDPSMEKHKDWNAYRDYTPEKVMKIFDDTFLRSRKK
jgi:glycosyltransferase involved in cell wall biosynthesis|tara:strand:+ start:1712 stop:2662 length:951 start_codon:yes stop_codon:yes gene_type:complete